MPIVINEPLSFLQRLVEYMEYVELLEKADEELDPSARIQYVAAFAVSAVSSNWNRIGKPFNPLLGETYELEKDNYRIICEQVSHHPPVSAFHAEGDHFVFRGSIYPKLKFWGKSVEIQPEGVVTAYLKRWDESYTWSNVTCSVHNVVVGKIWIEQSGTMQITNHKTGHKAILHFKPAGWFSKDTNRVEGFVLDPNTKQLKFLYGRWSEYLRCADLRSYEQYLKENPQKFRDTKNSESSPSSHTPKKVFEKFNSFKMGSSMFKSMSIAERDDVDEPVENGDEEPSPKMEFQLDIPNSVTLWEAKAKPEFPPSNQRQNGNVVFTEFIQKLNRLEPSMIGKICQTDSRFRPDIRRLENKDVDGAASEKTRLEEKQREVRSLRKRRKIPEWTPRWFRLEMNDKTNAEEWVFTGKYWDRVYPPDPDIY